MYRLYRLPWAQVYTMTGKVNNTPKNDYTVWSDGNWLTRRTSFESTVGASPDKGLFLHVLAILRSKEKHVKKNNFDANALLSIIRNNDHSNQ